jgi:hypothetical protein
MFALASMLVLGGCATPSVQSRTPAKLVVNTGKVEASVRVVSITTRGGPPTTLVEGKTKGGIFEILVDQAGGDSVYVIAEAPGYETEKRHVSQHDKANGGEVRLYMSESTDHRLARIEQETTQRREAYVAAHLDLDAATREAISKGEVKVGMTTADVHASWGEPSRKNTSGGIGGEFITWIYRRGYDGINSDMLFFAGGRLTGWSLDR